MSIQSQKYLQLKDILNLYILLPWPYPIKHQLLRIPSLRYLLNVDLPSHCLSSVFSHLLHGFLG